MSTDTKGPPLFGLPLGGVAFGLLWVAGALYMFGLCFFGKNYFAPPPSAAKELVISNAAFAKEEAGERAAPPAAPQP